MLDVLSLDVKFAPELLLLIIFLLFETLFELFLPEDEEDLGLEVVSLDDEEVDKGLVEVIVLGTIVLVIGAVGGVVVVMEAKNWCLLISRAADVLAVDVLVGKAAIVIK